MELSFRAQKALRGMDLGEDLGDGVFMKDLGRYSPPAEAPPEKAEKLDPRKPLTRAQRERVPATMAANLMDYYIQNLNDPNMLNPIRDGIPQCKNHPFEKGTAKTGCINSCAKKYPDLALPVARDYTLGDVFSWVKKLVLQGVGDVERQRGWRRPTDLTR